MESKGTALLYIKTGQVLYLGPLRAIFLESLQETTALFLPQSFHRALHSQPQALKRRRNPSQTTKSKNLEDIMRLRKKTLTKSSNHLPTSPKKTKCPKSSKKFLW